MKRRLLFVFLVLIVLAVSTASIFIYLKKETPLKAIQRAREAISLAEKEKSLAYANVPFLQAKVYYDSAMLHWQKENEKWFFQRAFDISIDYAEKSTWYAQEAVARTKKSSNEIKTLLHHQIADINKTVEHFESTYKKMPLTPTLRKQWTQGRIILEEGILAYKGGNYLKAIDKLDSAYVLIQKVYQYPQGILHDYFTSLPRWIREEKEIRERSVKEKKVVLVVDKYNRELKVYKNGSIQSTYEVELGPNWVGDKHLQGDKTTPEGLYQVLKKKNEKDTKYFRALLLNYPNEEDKARFEENQKQGVVGEKAKIGGLIEIHGNGGKGIDWTEGCIALTDKEVDKLFALCSVGTEVLIVGSLTPIKVMGKW
jgi:hypothetical protein